MRKVGAAALLRRSHKGSSSTPKPFEAEESGATYLCMCKQTRNPPYCDGSHKSIASIPSDQGAEKAPNLITPTPEEPQVALIHELAENGLSKTGHHGEVGAMGIPGPQLPRWDDIQTLIAQLATKPLLDEVEVGTDLIIGRNAQKPLVLKIPLLVSDMSFGALSEEAKVALAMGAELAICSGEGGMLPEEHHSVPDIFMSLRQQNSATQKRCCRRAPRREPEVIYRETKVKGKIAAVRRLQEGTDAVSPATFSDLSSVDDFRRFGDRVRALTGGIPIGFKLSAQHMEFAVQAGANYIILNGRGGGTGAAPLIFRDHISVPTIPALARARSYLDKNRYDYVSLMITGGLRTPADFVKALCLGADGIALSNAAMQAIGCVAARMCNTNNCPAGIATQRPELRKQVDPGGASKRLARFLESSVALMKLLAQACGHRHFSQFSRKDLTIWKQEKQEMSELSGVSFGGVSGYPS